MIWFFVVLAVFVFAYVKNVKNASHITDEHIIPFSGGVGAGKTFMAVTALKKRYGSLLFKYNLRHIPLLKKWSIKVKPEVYSSIPLRFRVRGKYVYSHVMTAEHWKMEKKLPENCLILADEFGQIASQYDFDNPYVQINVQTLVRFLRHFTNGYLYLTDQSASNIAVQIRRRFNIVYNVSNFRRWRFLGLIPMPFYKVNVSKLQVTEDNISNANLIHNENNDEVLDYFFGYLPFFGQKKKKNYETRCYKYAYEYGFVDDRAADWNNLYTRFMADISCSSDLRKSFKANKQYLSYGDPDPVPFFSIPQPADRKARRNWLKSKRAYDFLYNPVDINENAPPLGGSPDGK